MYQLCILIMTLFLFKYYLYYNVMNLSSEICNILINLEIKSRIPYDYSILNNVYHVYGQIYFFNLRI